MKSKAAESKNGSRGGRRECGCKDDGQDVDSNHNDMPPKPSPAFSTSLSSPSLLALGKGRNIGLASNPTEARSVGLDIPGEPITGLENAKFGWVNDICVTTGDVDDELGTDIGIATGIDIRGDPRKYVDIDGDTARLFAAGYGSYRSSCLRLFERTALEVEGGVYLHELGPELGVTFGEPKEKTGSTSMYDEPTGLTGPHKYISSPLMLCAGVPLLEMLMASVVAL